MVAGVTTIPGAIAPTEVAVFCPAVAVLNRVRGLLPAILEAAGARVSTGFPPTGVVMDKALGLLLPVVVTETSGRRLG